MAILSRDEFLARVQARVGDDSSNDALTFIEDMTDTIESLQANNGEDWKARYEQNDADWRKKYKERFFSPQTTGEGIKKDQTENVQTDGEIKTFADLFKKVEG
jgi:hypothetical protein